MVYCIVVVVVVVLLEVVEVDPACDETFPDITNLQMALQVSCLLLIRSDLPILTY